MISKTLLVCLTALLGLAVAADDFVPGGKDGVAIQAAIDKAAAAGGGRVTLTPGVWPSGTLYLKSRVELHLEKGAVLKGGTKPEDYDDVETHEGIYPEKSKKVFIVAEDAEDVAITARGRNGILSLHPYRYLRPDDRGYLKTSDLVFENWSIEGK